MKNKKDNPRDEAQRIFQQPYSRVLKAAEEGGFTAEVLEFPGCFAEGETWEEASTNLLETALTWIEECLEKGEAVPGPQQESEYGGKIALRLSKSQHAKAVAHADKDGVSLNQFLVAAVAECLGERKVSRQSGAKFTIHLHASAATSGSANPNLLNTLLQTATTAENRTGPRRVC